MSYSFKVVSGELIISDPCHDKDSDTCTYAAKNGIWEAREREKGRFLIANHIDYPFDERDLLYSNVITDIAVDSGQLGLFDSTLYPEGETGTYDDPESFYGRCCAVEDYAGSIDGLGINVKTLYGDGLYPMIGIYGDDGALVSIAIDFAGTFDEEVNELSYDDPDWWDEVEDSDNVYLSSLASIDPDIGEVEFDDEF